MTMPRKNVALASNGGMVGIDFADWRIGALIDGDVAPSQASKFVGFGKVTKKVTITLPVETYVDRVTIYQRPSSIVDEYVYQVQGSIDGINYFQSALAHTNGSINVAKNETSFPPVNVKFIRILFSALKGNSADVAMVTEIEVWSVEQLTALDRAGLTREMYSYYQEQQEMHIQFSVALFNSMKQKFIDDNAKLIEYHHDVWKRFMGSILNTSTYKWFWSKYVQLNYSSTILMQAEIGKLVFPKDNDGYRQYFRSFINEYTAKTKNIVLQEVVDAFAALFKEINIIPTESAFTVSTTSGVAPLTVEFINQSVNATKYLWNFGD
ncbi:MAG: discoidin domain-containing protein [Nanoarchaeota archaeon]